MTNQERKRGDVLKGLCKCGKEFYYEWGRGRPVKWCSEKCRCLHHTREWRRKAGGPMSGDVIEVKCKACGKEFSFTYGGAGRPKSYCSPECIRAGKLASAKRWWAANRGERIQANREFVKQLKLTAGGAPIKLGPGTRYGIRAMQRGWDACMKSLMSQLAVHESSESILVSEVRRMVTESPFGEGYPNEEEYAARLHERHVQAGTTGGVA